MGRKEIGAAPAAVRSRLASSADRTRRWLHRGRSTWRRDDVSRCAPWLAAEQREYYGRCAFRGTSG